MASTSSTDSFVFPPMEEMNYSYELDNFEELRILLNSDYNALDDLSSRSPYLPEIRSLPSCSQSSPLDYTSGPNTINYSWASSSTPSMSATQEGSDLFETYIQNTANGQTFVDNSWQYSMNQFLNNVSSFDQPSLTEPAMVPAETLASLDDILPATSFDYSLPATSSNDSLKSIAQTTPKVGLHYYYSQPSSSSSILEPLSARAKEELYAPTPSPSDGGKDTSGGISSRRKTRLSAKSTRSSEMRRHSETKKSISPPTTDSTNRVFDTLPAHSLFAEASWKMQDDCHASSASASSSSGGGRDTSGGISCLRAARRVEKSPVSKKQPKQPNPPQKRNRLPALPTTSGYAETITRNGRRFIIPCRYRDCHETFEGVDKLEEHVKWDHGIPGGKGCNNVLVPCEWNGCRIMVKSEEHLRTILKSLKTTFKCSKCPRTMCRLSDIKRHCEMAHSGENAVWDEVYKKRK
ncbi:hypothetical protein CPB84DRAFT_1962050 [Gymnopilus junonius]|uniref:C2H2-type domain-containing protein n=1 Tax=Gymnopilus junonius TaxID=109634 RepID=A0A9P5NLH7_GYMJU|nr:hypothetical protein CPB84DRAFT_1962050 [Gymnopilus junonius]